MKDLGFVDSPQARHNGKQKREDEIGRKIVDIALRYFDIFLNHPTESELVAKTLKEDHPAKVSQAGIFERKMQCSQAFWHLLELFLGLFEVVAQTVQIGRFVPQTNCKLIIP